MRMRLNFKQYLSFAILIILLLLPLLTSCSNGNMSNTENGLYIAKWYGYSGITNTENAIVSVPFICVGGEEYGFSSSYNSNQCEVLIDSKPLTDANLMKWAKDSVFGRYALYTLTITLPKIDVGVHRVSKIKVPTVHGEMYFPLHWVVEVKNESEKSKCIEVVGQSTLSGSVLTGIDFELQNNCSYPFIVDEVHFVIDGYNVKETLSFAPYNLPDNRSEDLKISDTRDNEDKNLVINPSQKRTIRMSFAKSEEELPKFISIKPFILSHTANSDSKYFAEFYSPSIFSLFPNNEKDIETFLKTDFVKGEGK